MTETVFYFFFYKNVDTYVMYKHVIKRFLFYYGLHIDQEHAHVGGGEVVISPFSFFCLLISHDLLLK